MAEPPAPVPTEPPTPLAFVGQLTQFWVLPAIYAIVDLGLVDLLADGARSSDDLALATGTHAPTVYRLLRALTSVDVVVEQPSRHFVLTPLGTLLRRDVPGSVRNAALFFGNPATWTAWGALSASVRTGTPAFDQVHGRDIFAYLAQHPAYGEVFDLFMAASAQRNRAVAAAYDFAPFRTAVDVGGGHGALLAAVLQANPQLRGVLFDAPHVVAGAASLLTTAGVADRCTVVGGDFFTAVPEGGDIYLLSGILHDWGDEQATTILRRCRTAMPADGRVLCIGRILASVGIAPQDAFLDLNMHVLTPGRERTQAELAQLLASAGFRPTRVIPLPQGAILEAVPV